MNCCSAGCGVDLLKYSLVSGTSQQPDSKLNCYQSHALCRAKLNWPCCWRSIVRLQHKDEPLLRPDAVTPLLCCATMSLCLGACLFDGCFSDCCRRQVALPLTCLPSCCVPVTWQLAISSSEPGCCSTGTLKRAGRSRQPPFL